MYEFSFTWNHHHHTNIIGWHQLVLSTHSSGVLSPHGIPA